MSNRSKVPRDFSPSFLRLSFGIACTNDVATNTLTSPADSRYRVYRRIDPDIRRGLFIVRDTTQYYYLHIYYAFAFRCTIRCAKHTRKDSAWKIQRRGETGAKGKRREENEKGG